MKTKMKSVLKRSILILLLGVTTNTLAQDEELQPQFTENIVTDRPDQTEAPALTPKKWMQFEIGVQSEFDKADGYSSQSSLYPTVLAKYGLSKRFELRLITEYAKDNFKVGNLNSSTSGLAQFTVGSKIAISEAKGWLPQISLITHLELPWIASKDYRPSTIVPRYRFLFCHPINDRINFSYNLGMEWENGSSVSTTIYTASLGFALTDNIGCFVESYGFLRENTSGDNRLDGGVTFLLNSNHQLDVSAGFGLNEISPDYFVSCGYSFRLNAFDKNRKKSK